MTNSSSLSRALAGAGIAVAAIIAALALVSAGLWLAGMLVSVVALAGGVAACCFVVQAQRTVRDLSALCGEPGGVRRVPHPHADAAGGELGELRRSIGAIDQRAGEAGRVLGKVASVCHEIANGNFEARVLDIRETGELAALQHELNDMIDRCDAFVRESSAAMQAVRGNRYYRRILPHGLRGSLLAAAQVINQATEAIQQRIESFARETNRFEGEVGSVVEKLFLASSAMDETASVLNSGASATRERASAVAAASEETSTNMQTVAAATTELNTSAHDVSQQVTHTAGIARQAVSKADDANRTVEGLSAAADRIGEVVELISTIAAQTNLLALNATIEAARAGDAGRGFAIVAQEVKTLAGQTARATEEISAQVANVQTNTKSAVEAIGMVGRTIAELDQITTYVAEAVKAQMQATDEIARNVEQASAGTRDIAVNIHGVTENAGDTEQQAGRTKSASDSMSQQAEHLGQEVNKFLTALRDGPLRRGQDDPGRTGPDHRSPGGAPKDAGKRREALRLAG
jgi:methyl-accepting chemotaxis protein